MQNMTMEDQLSTNGGGMVACGIGFGILAVAVADPILWPALIASGELIGMTLMGACVS